MMGLATSAVEPHGRSLAWEPEQLLATNIRIAYLSHLPGVGPWLCRLAIGGDAVRRVSALTPIPGPAGTGACRTMACWP